MLTIMEITAQITKLIRRGRHPERNESCVAVPIIGMPGVAVCRGEWAILPTVVIRSTASALFASNLRHPGNIDET